MGLTSASGAARGLVLFDIDHTLLDVLSFHNAAYESVFNSTHGTAVRLAEIQHAGKTTPRIFRDLGAHAGIEERVVEDRLEQMLESFMSSLLRSLPDDLTSKVLPGVVGLLETLTQRGHVLGIVTGNPRRVGLEVLRRAGLLRFFSVFGFGTEAPERWQLVRLAMERAGTELGHAVSPGDVVVVGDTPFDVEAGRLAGTHTLAVVTGLYDQAALEASGAERIVANFSDVLAACQAIEALKEGRPGTLTGAMGEKR